MILQSFWKASRKRKHLNDMAIPENLTNTGVCRCTPTECESKSILHGPHNNLEDNFPSLNLQVSGAVLHQKGIMLIL